MRLRKYYLLLRSRGRGGRLNPEQLLGKIKPGTVDRKNNAGGVHKRNVGTKKNHDDSSDEGGNINRKGKKKVEEKRKGGAPSSEAR